MKTVEKNLSLSFSLILTEADSDHVKLKIPKIVMIIAEILFAAEYTPFAETFKK